MPATKDLKKISRAYYEIKFNPQGGYVRNYDKIETLKQKEVRLVREESHLMNGLLEIKLKSDLNVIKAKILSRMQQMKVKYILSSAILNMTNADGT
jgi:hypothetical protein